MIFSERIGTSFILATLATIQDMSKYWGPGLPGLTLLQCSVGHAHTVFSISFKLMQVWWDLRRLQQYILHQHMHLERDHQELYYTFYNCIFTGASEMIREGHTLSKVITPSLVQLPG